MKALEKFIIDCLLIGGASVLLGGLLMLIIRDLGCTISFNKGFMYCFLILFGIYIARNVFYLISKNKKS